MTMDITRETFIWRICYALFWSIAIHYILFSTYICMVNFSLWNINILNLPFQALLSIHNLYILPLAAIMFFKGVILSRHYFTQNKTEIIFKRLHLFMNFFTFHNFLGLLFHILLGVAIPFVYTLTNNEYQSFNVDCLSDESPNIFGGTPVCLNEAKFFLICAGVWNGFYSYYKYYIFNSGCLIFPFIQQNKFIRVKTSIYSTVKNAMNKAITPCLLFCVIYYFKGNVPRSYFSFIKDLKLSSDLIDCLYGIFKIKLLLNLWFFATIYFVTIDLMQILMIVFLTERISFPVTKYTYEEENRGLLLKDALACASIPIIHHHGYLDLSLLSQFDSTKRAEIFALSQPGGHPHTWNVIVAECLKIINKLTDDINNCTPSAHSNILDQLRNSNILKKTDMHENTIQEVQYQKMRCLSPRINNCTDNTSVPTLYDSYEKLIQICREWLKNKVDAFYKKPIVIYFLGELTEPKIKHVYCQSQPVIWAIEGLSFLICHSLEEDPYGVVQKDISKIISAFLNLKNSIEKLQKQCIFFGKFKKIESYDIQMRDSLKFSIKQSIYRIIIIFKNYVNDLNLESDDLKSQLSNFVHFKEV